MTAPLKGVRILDLTTFLAAPQCCRALAAMGADVVKVEAPNKDFFRIESPLFEVGIPCTDDENPIFLNTNAGKRFITLNLTQPEAVEIFKKLVAQSDALVSNMRLSALKKLGIDYDSLKNEFPHLVYAHLDGYGLKGEESPKPGFDSQAYLARGGYLLDLNEPGSWPNDQVLGIGDSATGTALYVAVMSALIAAKKTGKGSYVDVALQHASNWGAGFNLLLSQFGMDPECSRKEPQTYALEAVYECSDGRWISLSCGGDLLGEWAKLCKVLGREDLISDPRFQTRENHHENRAVAVAILDEIFKTKTYAEWDEILWNTGVIYDKVAEHLLEVLEDEQCIANELFGKREYLSGKTVYFATPPFKVQGVKPEDLAKPVHFGGCTDEILTELGYGAEDITRMHENGIVI